MRNKVSSQTRLESSVPCKNCGETTVEVVNLTKTDANRIALKCTKCNTQIKGNNLFELLKNWEEINTEK